MERLTGELIFIYAYLMDTGNSAVKAWEGQVWSGGVEWEKKMRDICNIFNNKDN